MKKLFLLQKLVKNLSAQKILQNHYNFVENFLHEGDILGMYRKGKRTFRRLNRTKRYIFRKRDVPKGRILRKEMSLANEIKRDTRVRGFSSDRRYIWKVHPVRRRRPIRRRRLSPNPPQEYFLRVFRVCGSISRKFYSFITNLWQFFYIDMVECSRKQGKTCWNSGQRCGAAVARRFKRRRLRRASGGKLVSAGLILPAEVYLLPRGFSVKNMRLFWKKALCFGRGHDIILWYCFREIHKKERFHADHSRNSFGRTRTA